MFIRINIFYLLMKEQLYYKLTILAPMTEEAIKQQIFVWEMLLTEILMK